MTLSLTFKGFAYVAFIADEYANDDSLGSLVDTGANAIEASLEYGIDADDDTVVVDPNYTDSLADLGATIKEAVGLGENVMVRPLIDFVAPSELTGTPYAVDDWRSYYNPGAAGSASANKFFASYKTLILQEAAVAEADGASSFCIGTEMDQITGPAYKSYWVSIINAIRTADPDLKLTYSAEWNDAASPWTPTNSGVADGLSAGTGNLATQVSFASDLDYLGIDCYAPISNLADPTLAELISGWTNTPIDSGATSGTYKVTGNQSLISYFESVAATVGKPLIFTELGYQNANDADSSPFYTQTGVVDTTGELQANLYQAFFDAWQQAGNSSLTGVYFWDWDPNTTEVGPGTGVNFSPQGLPAQTVVTDEFASSDDYTGGGQTVTLSASPGNEANLFSTDGDWDSVSGSDGTVNLTDAQASIFGAGDAIQFLGSDDQVSLYSTVSAWDTVSGDDGVIYLTGSQASVVGGGDTIDFSGGSGNAVSLYQTFGNYDTVDGSDGTIYLTGAQTSVYGGGDTIYLAGGSGNVANLADTNGDWDLIDGSNGVFGLYGAQTSVLGGGDTIDFAGGTGNAVSLYATSGDWDTVGGSDGTVYLSDAQASVIGGGDSIFMLGAAGNAVSLYSTGGNWDAVSGSNATLYLTDAQASVFGGDDTINLLGASGNAVSLYSTAGNWDAIVGSGGTVYMTSAQASVFGGGDTIDFAGGSGNAASLYLTNGDADAVNGSSGTLYLTNAQASLTGGSDTLNMAGASTATVNGGTETFAFQAAIGNETINGFSSSDTIDFAKSDFVSWQVLNNGHYISQSALGAVITLDGADTVTLTNIQASSLTSGEFRFV